MTLSFKKFTLPIINLSNIHQQDQSVPNNIHQHKHLVSTQPTKSRSSLTIIKDFELSSLYSTKFQAKFHKTTKQQTTVSTDEFLKSAANLSLATNHF